MPVTWKKYKSDNECFRSIGFGRSQNISIAKQMALMNAKEKIASDINSSIKGYITKRDSNSKEFIIREIINQQLINIKIINEKEEKRGIKYKYWIAIEISKQVILKAFSTNIFLN